MSYFLLEYDRLTHERLLRRFSDSALALRELATAEARRRPQTEVILFLAANEADLRRTHGRFFYSPRELAERMEQDVREHTRRQAV